MKLSATLLAALLCLPPAPALAEGANVLVVRPEGEGPSARRMRIFWKGGIGEDNKVNRLGGKSRRISIPGKFYVGTELQPPRTSLHLWEFRSGFVEAAGLKDGLRLPLRTDPNDCFDARGIKQWGEAYNSNSSTADLLSGVILFGHLREVCSLKDRKDSADEAAAQVRAFYTILTARTRQSFTGRMCRASRTGESC